MEFLEIQENYISNDHKRLKRELVRSKEELKRIQANPLSISSFIEMVDENYALIGSNSGTTYFVRVMSTLDREKLKPNTSIATHKSTYAVVDILPIETDASIQMMKMTE